MYNNKKCMKNITVEAALIIGVFLIATGVQVNDLFHNLVVFIGILLLIYYNKQLTNK